MYYLGLDMTGETIFAVMVDETGTIHGQGHFLLNAPRSADEIIEDMAYVSRVALSGKGYPVTISGGGAAFSGEVDETRGLVINCTHTGFKNVELTRIFKRRSGVTAAVCSRARAKACGEAVHADAEACVAVGAALFGAGYKDFAGGKR